MAKENSSRQQHLRQLIAQHAARMMAEDGVADYALAKRKASRQLGVEDTQCLPSNAEISQELRVYQGIYLGEEQPEQLRQLRIDALATMQLLKQFNPSLTGAVLDGTAGRYAETDIHLYADSDKEVEMFLLNSKIPYQTKERSYFFNGERRKVPVFVLEGPHGAVLLSVFSPAEAYRNTTGGIACAGTVEVEAILNNMAI
jgi:hypothetical protein